MITLLELLETVQYVVVQRWEFDIRNPVLRKMHEADILILLQETH
jgi:hypothetical protein